MRFAGSCSIAIALLLLLSAIARSQDTVAAEKPYASIVARNMFGLLPIPPPDTNPPAAPVDPPPKISLNGIMTIFGRDQALFKVSVKPAPGQPAKENSYVLSEGERQDDIEVIKINHADSIVTFNNHGTTQELPLVEAGSSSGSTAPSGGAGGGPAPRGPMAGFPRPGQPMSPADRIAMARERMAGRPGFGNPAQQNMNFGGSTYQPAGAQQSQQNIEDQVMQAANNMATIEQNRLATQDAVSKGLMPPIPPTQLTPQEILDNGGPNGAPLITPPTPPTSLTPPTSYNSSRPSSTPIYGK